MGLNPHLWRGGGGEGGRFKGRWGGRVGGVLNFNVSQLKEQESEILRV